MSQPAIFSCPWEIWLCIITWLSPTDYGGLRATCKYLDSLFFTLFAERYFECKAFMRNEESLQVLIDISQSRLSSYLREVILSTELVPSFARMEGRDNGEEYYQPIEWSHDAANRYYSRYASQTLLLATGHDINMLVDAFTNLHNLEAVSLRFFKGTSEDPPSAAGYGFMSFMRSLNLGRKVRCTTMQEDAIACVPKLLAALGRSGARPKTFKMLFSRRHFRSGDSGFHIPAYLQSLVDPVLEGLETLHLELSAKTLDTGNARFVAMDRKGIKTWAVHTYFLADLTRRMTNLQHLTIDRLGWFDQNPGEDLFFGAARIAAVSKGTLLRPQLPLSPTANATLASQVFEAKQTAHYHQGSA